MKIIVRKSFVDVVGRIWMPRSVCSLRIDVNSYDIDNMRDDDRQITRESVEQWLTMHSGDFSEVIDFRASIEDGDNTIDIDFATEDGEMAYLDTLSVKILLTVFTVRSNMLKSDADIVTELAFIAAQSNDTPDRGFYAMRDLLIHHGRMEFLEQQMSEQQRQLEPIDVRD